ncbi:MAG: hypothetical protein D6719_01905 [Candidatus Dadabacteria bacterium]|nr:MAG: hypothetical protein D6719_01905 [Candidatus Dadabacteria bacterium]
MVEGGSEYTTLSEEEANRLVLEHQGWAESIAKSVARAWNMDWRLDGLDGAAMEALIFCSRRFQPERGVPFRGYARKRIHEASTEAARRSRGWRRGSSATRRAREISAEMLNMYPELRSGRLPYPDESSGYGEDNVRSAVRQLLVGATLISARQAITESSPEEAMDYKKLVEIMAKMEPVHQLILWKVYWEGSSMRSVATEWNTDELNVIREHQVLLTYLQKTLSKGSPPNKKLKVRPGLKDVAIKLKKSGSEGPFSALVSKGESHG